MSFIEKHLICVVFVLAFKVLNGSTGSLPSKCSVMFLYPVPLYNGFSFVCCAKCDPRQINTVCTLRGGSQPEISRDMDFENLLASSSSNGEISVAAATDKGLDNADAAVSSRRDDGDHTALLDHMSSLTVVQLKVNLTRRKTINQYSKFPSGRPFHL